MLDERHPLDPCRRSERLVVDESRFVHPGACTVQLRRVAHVRLRLQAERGERNERHCRIPSLRGPASVSGAELRDVPSVALPRESKSSALRMHS